LGVAGAGAEGGGVHVWAQQLKRYAAEDGEEDAHEEPLDKPHLEI